MCRGKNAVHIYGGIFAWTQPGSCYYLILFSFFYEVFGVKGDVARFLSPKAGINTCKEHAKSVKKPVFPAVNKNCVFIR